MEELGAGVVSVLTSLMPGFIFAWVFYSLTTHRKPSQFDQVVYALIATTVLHPIVALESDLFLWVGRWRSFGSWSDDSKLAASVITALLAGAGVAQLARHDAIFQGLRRLKLTTRNHNTSEWCTVFENTDLNVVLHLKNERRIYGWPFHWPSDHRRGHFYLVQAEWLSDDGERIPLSGVEGILINVVDVEMVEFVKGEAHDKTSRHQAEAGTDSADSRECEHEAGAGSERQAAAAASAATEEKVGHSASIEAVERRPAGWGMVAGHAMFAE